MSELYQYQLKNIKDLKDWFSMNDFNMESFKKIIVESVEQVKPFDDFDKALDERLITKIRFFNEDCDFSVTKNDADNFDVVVMTENKLPYKDYLAYNIIESQDITNYSSFDHSKFTIRRYICEPLVTEYLDNYEVFSLPELLVFYRIYG